MKEDDVVSKELRESRDRMAFPDFKDHQGYPENQDHKDSKVLKDLKGHLANLRYQVI